MFSVSLPLSSSLDLSASCRDELEKVFLSESQIPPFDSEESKESDSSNSSCRLSGFF